MAFLSRERDPETGVVRYRCTAAAPPGLVRPRRLHGVAGDSFVRVEVERDRVTLERGWVFTSGHMDAWETDREQVLGRGDSGWPASLVATLREWCGDELAGQVWARLEDPAAFDDEG